MLSIIPQDVVRFSCKSDTKEKDNETVSVARDLVPWTSFSANDDSGRVGHMEATCGVAGLLSPSVGDYTCTRDCEAPQIDGSIMGSTGYPICSLVWVGLTLILSTPMSA